MKQKNILLLVFTFSVILSSCKKDAKTAAPSPTTHNNNGTTSQGYDAAIYVLKQIALDGISGSLSDYHGAVFYGSTATNTSVPSVKAGIVSINGIILKNDSSNIAGPIYADTTFAISGNSYQINVSGSNQFPVGALQYGQNFPTFNDTALLPSTIQLSTGISIQFNNCIDTDSIGFILQDGIAGTVSKKYAVSNNQVHLIVSPSELSTFTQTNNGGITVDLVKNNAAIVGTKNYLVTLEKRYFKLYVQFN